MSEPNLSMTLDDDLPRTVRRERDAREREAREREARDRDARERAQRDREMSTGPGMGPPMGSGMGPSIGPAPASLAPHQPMQAPSPMRMDHHDDADLPAPPATVTAFDVPFLNLMMFFLKAVVAGIPALLLLGAVMWGVGQALQTFFPALLKLKILIYVPQIAG
jgi:hypothetical protein